MRIIKEKTLFGYCKQSQYRLAEGSLKAWIYEVRYSTWKNSRELKLQFGNASIISSKRVVFNVKGNDYRLIVDIEYKLKIVFVVWFGTHAEYNKIDAKAIGMKTRIIKTEQEYNKACERVYSLIHSTGKPIEPDSPEGEELDLLSLLIEKYELEHFPLSAPGPIEAIKFRMDQMNLKQADIAPLFGGKTRVSEVLHGKRQLTLKMITLLNMYLGIPLESLVMGNSRIKLEAAERRKILSKASIMDYVKNREELTSAQTR